MSIAKAKSRTDPSERNQWLDYLLIFICIPILHKKYPARSQEPVERTAMMIVYMIKTPVHALSVYVLEEYLFRQHLLNTVETYLFIGSIIGFWEFVFGQTRLDERALRLLKDRRIRQRTEAFMKDKPTLGSTLVWISFFAIIGYVCFFLIYLGLAIITPVNLQG